MSLNLTVVVFLACLVLTLLASALLTRGLDELGCTLRIPAGLFGLITALGANAPEISTSVSAILSGARDVGLGVVFGSNIFNLAALLGLSAVVAPKVRVRRSSLALHGGVGLWVTLVGGALVLGWLSPPFSMVLMGVVALPYAVVLGMKPHRLRQLRLPDRLTEWLARSVSEDSQEESEAMRDDLAWRQAPPWKSVLVIVLGLSAIIGGSVGMVRTSLVLAHAWSVPQRIVGTVVLAALTGLPNAYTAVRLARRGEGAAVVSEAFNSNTLNILIGIGVPALLFGLAKPSTGLGLEVAWLIGMTLAVGLLAVRRRELTRMGGGIVIALYLAFVGIWIAHRF